MMVSTKQLVISAIVCAVTCAAGYFGRPFVEKSQPMPEAQPLIQGIGPPTVRTSRIEVVDAAGRLAFILTAEDGNPFIIVNVNGRAEKIDLAYVARRLR